MPFFKRHSKQDADTTAKAASRGAQSLKKLFKRKEVREDEGHAEARDPRPPSSLLDLPSEIRNIIYDFASHPTTNTLVVKHSREPLSLGKTIMNLNVLRVCRQMRLEALSRLCSSKRIVLVSPRVACDFLEYVGSAVGDITNLQFVHVWCVLLPYPRYQVEAFLGYLVQMASLRSFELTSRRQHFPTDGPLAQMLDEEWPFMKEIIAVVKERTDIKFTRSK
jgi:hypothetical protein